MNKTVLVTGASRGIGKAIAAFLCQNGWQTAIGYCKNAAAANELALYLNKCGGTAMALNIDVTDSQGVKNAVQLVQQKFGGIDALVNNAGIAQQKMFCDITEIEWQQMLDVNLTGAYRTTQAVLPYMVKQKCGSIVNIASMWGQTGGSCEVHYSAAKGGLIAMTKALAKELGPSSIRVNCVSPGVIDTDMMAAFNDNDKKALADETPLCRIGTAQEVAQAVEFLLSEKAAFITGQILNVNGGILI